MREIKFRAWLEDTEVPGSNEQMIYGLDKDSYMKFLRNAIKEIPDGENDLKMANGIHTKKGFVYRMSRFWQAAYSWLGTYHIMQYTGLRDKNDSRIYEGDIIESDLLAQFEMIWNDEVAGFSIKQINESNTPHLKNCLFTFNSDDSKMCKIIGNIHENPELLK